MIDSQTIRWTIVSVLVIGGVVFLSASSNRHSFSRVFNGSPTTTETARQSVIGTWSGNQNDYGVQTWRRYDFRPDGSFITYLADPSDKGWGEPIKAGTWIVGSAKYSDTGQHYFFVEMQWDTRGTPYAVGDGQAYTARYPLLDGKVQIITEGVKEAILERGDNFPY